MQFDHLCERDINQELLVGVTLQVQPIIISVTLQPTYNKIKAEIKSKWIMKEQHHPTASPASWHLQGSDCCSDWGTPPHSNPRNRSNPPKTQKTTNHHKKENKKDSKTRVGGACLASLGGGGRGGRHREGEREIWNGDWKRLRASLRNSQGILSPILDRFWNTKIRVLGSSLFFQLLRFSPLFKERTYKATILSHLFDVASNDWPHFRSMSFSLENWWASLMFLGYITQLEL